MRESTWILSLSIALILLAPGALAEDPPPADPAPPPPPTQEAKPPEARPQETSPAQPPVTPGPTLEELRALIAQQQAQIAAQGKLIDDQMALVEGQAGEIDKQRRQLADQKKEIESQRATLLGMQTRIDQLATGKDQGMSQEEIDFRERLTKLEDRIAAEPEAPTDITETTDFPGSIRIPGTNAAFRIGGFVKASLVTTFDPLGTDDRFIVGSIPPSGQEGAGEARRFNLTARQSRANFDLRQQLSTGTLRAFIEADFAGELDGGSDVFRLRHAYGQYGAFIAGETWSAGVDTVAVPEEVDFEGLSARLQVRQPSVRYTRALNERFRLSLALEDPAPDIGGGEGVSQVPDTLVTFRRVDGRHMQASVVLRQIRAQSNVNPGVTDSAFGWGLSFSRVFRYGWAEKDNLLFQLNVGDGFGRYINDLGSVGGQDAVFDPSTGALHTLPVVAGYVAFQHWWGDTTRSTFVYSLVNVDNASFQLGDAYDRTQRATANFIFSPVSRVDLGVELLWGERRNNDDSSGSALQTQVTVSYLF